MNRMKFEEDISLEQIYEENKEIIYSEIIDKIEEVAENKDVDRIEVMELDRGGTIFTMDLKRNQFVPVLNSAIKYYVSDNVQEYELCQKCKDLIDRLAG